MSARVDREVWADLADAGGIRVAGLEQEHSWRRRALVPEKMPLAKLTDVNALPG